MFRQIHRGKLLDLFSFPFALLHPDPNPLVWGCAVGLAPAPQLFLSILIRTVLPYFTISILILLAFTHLPKTSHHIIRLFDYSYYYYYPITITIITLAHTSVPSSPQPSSCYYYLSSSFRRRPVTCFPSMESNVFPGTLLSLLSFYSFPLPITPSRLQPFPLPYH